MLFFKVVTRFNKINLTLFPRESSYNLLIRSIEKLSIFFQPIDKPFPNPQFDLLFSFFQFIIIINLKLVSKILDQFDNGYRIRNRSLTIPLPNFIVTKSLRQILLYNSLIPSESDLLVLRFQLLNITF